MARRAAIQIADNVSQSTTEELLEAIDELRPMVARARHLQFRIAIGRRNLCIADLDGRTIAQAHNLAARQNLHG
jgi:hypothetical protein